jgi:hypothetical protein
MKKEKEAFKINFCKTWGKDGSVYNGYIRMNQDLFDEVINYIKEQDGEAWHYYKFHILENKDFTHNEEKNQMIYFTSLEFLTVFFGYAKHKKGLPFNEKRFFALKNAFIVVDLEKA